jgi:hypothetical protein
MSTFPIWLPSSWRQTLTARPARTLGILAGLASLLLNVPALVFPVLMQDDFEILVQSWTWQQATENFWVPQNEHVMPLGRLFTYGLVRLAGRASMVPFAAAVVGPLGLLLALGLLYRFVRRELRHPLYALTAVILFGVSSVYQQAVFWFAASFSVLALDWILLALLAAQSWRQTGKAIHLDLCVLWTALAPAWFASGILAGPLCCLYLLPSRRQHEGTSHGRFDHVTLVPLLGTLLFLAVSLPRTAATIMHLPHYDGKTALEAFQPVTGFVYTCRSVVDNLLIGLLGTYTMDYALPVPLVVVLLVPLAAALFWWWRQAPDGRLLLLGAGLIGSSYLLTYSARAEWGYVGVMTGPMMGRYHLLPQLGLALVVCGGLPGRNGRWFCLDEAGVLSRGQVRSLALLIGLCFVVQLPRGVLFRFPPSPEQARAFLQIDALDSLCREQHISGNAAREVLPPLPIPGWGDGSNGWRFLRGSDDPHPHEQVEVRRLLQGRD